MNNLDALPPGPRYFAAALRRLMLVCALWAIASPAFGEDAPESNESDRVAVGTSPNGLRGLIRTALPVGPAELTVGASAGYGLIEAVPPSKGLNRLAGTLSAGVTPLPWLGVALTFDGRLDMHADDGMGAHDTAVGDPRLFVRIGHALSKSASLGAEAVAWAPGQNAPSFEPGATTAELKALFAYTPEHSAFALLTAAGFRLDNSGASAPDLTRLRPSDRLTLGLSDSNAVLLALGAAYRASQPVELFTELSADLLVGGKAPSLLQSPMRVALGGRYFLGPLQFELVASVSPSSRPGLAATDPLVPIEPRFLVLTGLRYAFSFGEPAKGAFVAPDKPLAVVQEPEPTAEAVPEVISATLAIVVRDDHGQPLSDARVVVKPLSGEAREAITDADGRFELTDVPLGTASIEVTAIGFQQLTWAVDIVPGMSPADAPPLVPKTDIGVLRGLTRSFGSQPVRARIEVRAGRGDISSVQSDADGRFELELPPGRYRVTIRAEGYKSQTRDVKVASNSVAILNVDLRGDQ